MGGYDPDAIGDLEARLLAVERRTMAMDGDLRTLRRGAIEMQQRIRDTWADRRLPTGTVAAAPICVTDFASTCGCLPLDIVVHDPYYGDTTLHYDTASLFWKGCKQVMSHASTGCPTSVSTALFYVLQGSKTTNTWALTWAYNQLSNSCPDPAATCASTGKTQLIQSSTATINCAGTTSWFFPFPFGFYPSSPTLTIHLPDGT